MELIATEKTLAWQKAKQFCLLDHPIRDLHGSTLGILGYGFLGQAVGRLAQAVGMQALISEHKAVITIREGRVPFDEVLRGSFDHHASRHVDQ